MRWKDKIEAIIVFLAAFLSVMFVIQPVLTAIHPMFAAGPAAYIVFISTVIVFFTAYAVAIEYERNSRYLFFSRK